MWNKELKEEIETLKRDRDMWQKRAEDFKKNPKNNVIVYLKNDKILTFNGADDYETDDDYTEIWKEHLVVGSVLTSEILAIALIGLTVNDTETKLWTMF